MPQGGATRRPGTKFVAAAADQTDAGVLIPFIFNTPSQAYMLDFANLTMRVYAEDGVVVSGMTPVDVTTPYTAANLAALWDCQSADTLFLTAAGYLPATVTRSSNTAWSYQTMTFKDGPYNDVNVTTTTLTPSGSSGSITVAASATTGINNGSGSCPRTWAASRG